MNQAIFRFTLMSTLLDPLKLTYALLLGLVVPVGMKWVTLAHGVAESQTFEMLTGSVGVAFVATCLCLGLAGNTSTQSGRGGEFLSLIFTRPITRGQYVITKWMAITLVCGVITAVQNILVAGLGVCYGESWTAFMIFGQVVERFFDAGILSAALILTMMAKNWIFQAGAMILFYVWLMGHTLPPVGVQGPTLNGTDEMAMTGTRVLLDLSHWVAEFVLPTISVYDSFNAPQFPVHAVAAYLSTLTIYLLCAVVLTNRREFFYGSK